MFFPIGRFELLKLISRSLLIIANIEHINFFNLLQKKKMVYLRFLLKVITICFRKKAEFNYKNNHKYNKLANL